MAKTKESSTQRIKRLKEGRELSKQKTKEYQAIEKKLKQEIRLQKYQRKAEQEKLKRIKSIRSQAGRTLKKVAGAYKYSPKLSRSLLNIGVGYNGAQPTQQRVKEGPGRPRGDFKHIDPFTGKPIPATLYYKRVKDFKRIAEQTSRQEDLQAIQQLSKRGIPPEQAKQIIDQRQLQSAGVQKVPQQVTQNISNYEKLKQLELIQKQLKQQQNQVRQVPQQLPNSYPSQAVRPIWRNREGRLDYDWGLFGRKVVRRGVPQSFWN